MKLVGRVPVEQLDDERLTNIERRVVSGAADAAARPSMLRAPRRYLGVVAAAMAAVAAGVIGWKLGGTRATQTVAQLAPKVAVQGHTLDIGDARIESDSSASFEVTRPDGGVLVTLMRGKVELDVDKRANRPPLLVRAGDTDVIVVGTQFSVDYGDGTGEVDVRVTEGVVRVVRHHQEATVAAGKAWATERGVIAIADATPLHTATTVATSSDGATIGEVETSGSDRVEIQMSNGPDVLHDRTAQVPDPRTPRPRGEGAEPTSRQMRDIATRPKTPTTNTVEPEAPTAKLIKQQPVMQPLDVGEDPASSIGKYQELIRNKTSGEEESRASYGIAFMQHFKLGRDADAQRTIMVYERRFAQGRVYPERAAIAWLKVRIACSRQINDECRQAAAAYVRLAGDSPAGRVAEKITLGD
ncbi:hypothetical protein BH11MYX3_BH11MYX3_07980 [soil metagenome]